MITDKELIKQWGIIKHNTNHGYFYYSVPSSKRRNGEYKISIARLKRCGIYEMVAAKFFIKIN